MFVNILQGVGFFVVIVATYVIFTSLLQHKKKARVAMFQAGAAKKQSPIVSMNPYMNTVTRNTNTYPMGINGNLMMQYTDILKQYSGAASANSADEIEKLTDLKDRGIITNDEFEAKKRQLLKT